jgi:hypothetical protein
MKKKIVALTLLFSFLIAPTAPVKAISEAEILAQLELLTVTLADIGRAISTSPDLTEEESAVLMTQLVAISSEIISIKALFNPIPTTALEEYVEEDNSRQTVEDAELEYLTVRFDSLTNSATATLNFSTTTRTRTFTLVPPPAATYGSKVDLITKQVLDSLSAEFGIRRGDMAQMLRFSSFDPARLGVVGKNSDLASEMAENFGKRSIVNRISVYPGSQKGRIEFFSDQKETLRLSLERKSDNTYTYNIDYFLHDMERDAPYFPTDYEGNVIVPEPVLEMLAEDITDDEVEEVTMAITAGIPFASSISDFDRKLVKFMTNNNIYYLADISRDVIPVGARDCYYSSDKTALSEFLVFIIEGVEAHYEPSVVSSAKYESPLTKEEYVFFEGCQNKKRFF